MRGRNCEDDALARTHGFQLPDDVIGDLPLLGLEVELRQAEAATGILFDHLGADGDGALKGAPRCLAVSPKPIIAAHDSQHAIEYWWCVRQCPASHQK